MRNTTRDLFDKYIQRQAELNHISAAHVTKAYSIDPSVEQTLEDKIQQSSEMLKKINIYGVNDQTGEKNRPGCEWPGIQYQQFHHGSPSAYLCGGAGFE